MGKEGDKLLERLVEQLYTNLNDYSEMEVVIKSARKIRAYIEKKGFEGIVDLLNKNKYNKKVSYKIFENAELYPNTKFLQWYSQKHGIESVGVGCIIKKEKNWRELKRDLRENESWSEALTLSPSEFSYNPTLPLHRTGFIFQGGFNLKSREHEMLHADHNCYSNVFEEITSWERRKHTEEEILFKQEAEFVSEISSYRNRLRYDKNWVIYGLISDYYNFNAKWIKKATGMSLKKIKKAMRPLKQKIPEAVDATIYLMDMLPNRVLTPLLFSVGPTKRDARKGKLHSSIGDIILWAEMIEMGKAKKNVLYKVLKDKGYRD